MIGKKGEECIIEILNSNKFDKDAFLALRKCFPHDEKDIILYLINILQAQYTDIDMKNIFINNNKDRIIDFLNRFIQSKLEYKYDNKKQDNLLTVEEFEHFKIFAAQTEKIPVEELAKTSSVLTTRSYLEMCRSVYDATFNWAYPNDISTAYLFCEARIFDYAHEYYEGIFGVDWNSPKEFAIAFFNSNHKEELRFGGPKLYICDESAHIEKNVYSRPDEYRQWTGTISCTLYDKKSVYESIKMYNALRNKGYPLYYFNYDEVYLTVQKNNVLYGR